MSVIKRIQQWDSRNRRRANDLLAQNFNVPAAEKFVRWYDHGVFRAIWPNFSKFGPTAYRSNYPNPKRLRKMHALGITTVLSLRGDERTIPFLLEEHICKALDMRLLAVKLEAIRPPLKAELLKLMDIFETLDQPFLMHCKSGADRTGLACAFYQIEILGMPVTEAKKMLARRYGHFRKSHTGVLDHILESYEVAALEKPQSVRDWLTHSYDEARIQSEFNELRKKS